jgi:hypothetical protein
LSAVSWCIGPVSSAPNSYNVRFTAPKLYNVEARSARRGLQCTVQQLRLDRARLPHELSGGPKLLRQAVAAARLEPPTQLAGVIGGRTYSPDQECEA